MAKVKAAKKEGGLIDLGGSSGAGDVYLVGKNGRERQAPGRSLGELEEERKAQQGQKGTQR